MKSQKRTQMIQAHQAAAQMMTAIIMTGFLGTSEKKCKKNEAINMTMNISIVNTRINDH